MTDKLKPCPFCNAVSVNNGAYPDKIGIATDPDNSGNYQVICLQCGASTDVYENKTKAVKAWNRRADSEK